MAKSSCAWLSLSLTFLVLFNGCLGRHSSELSPDECLLHKIQALEPNGRVSAEAGWTDYWDYNNQQFQCGGAHVFSHTIKPDGLLLPSYTNAPLITYVLRGKGEFGVVFPGCPETFQSPGESEKDDGERYQKTGVYNQGDVLVFTQGTAHWLHNTGRDDTVLVVVQDTSNPANQLDHDHPLRFFLAGKGANKTTPQGQREGRQQDEEELGYNTNILSGFDVKTLKDALNTDEKTAQKIVNSERRGHIITAARHSPEQSRRQSGRQQGQGGRGGGSSNGLEETLCTPRLQQNIDDPDRADIYDPQAGRLTALNSLTLPIFGTVRLSAARGVLNPNFGIVPKWNMNAHTLVYVIDGSARVKIVNQQAEVVLDEEVRRGQLFLVPQNFPVVIQAGQERFEWVEFNTNDNAMSNTLAGHASTFAGLPADIIAASYDISRSKALELKRNMVSTWFFQVSGESRFM